MVDAEFISSDPKGIVVYSVASQQLKLIPRTLGLRLVTDAEVFSSAVSAYLGWKANPNNQARIEFIRGECTNKINSAFACVPGKLRIPGVDDYYRSRNLDADNQASIDALCEIIEVEAIATKLRLAYQTFGTLRFLIQNSYSTVTIPKKGGNRSRLLYIPAEWLKRIQRHILKRIELVDKPSDHCHGYVKGRSILTGATPHVGKKIVLKLDIEKAFERTYTTHVRRGIREKFPQLSEDNVEIVTALTTYRGFLPTGAPTSPALLNISLYAFDSSIAEYIKGLDVTYTRYADDLTFSGDFDVPDLMHRVSDMLAVFGYRLNHGKTKAMYQSDRQMVTGIVVNKRPNVPRDYRRRLRAALHRLKTTNSAQWLGKAVSWGTLKGCASFVKGINPDHIAPSKELYWIAQLTKKARRSASDNGRTFATVLHGEGDNSSKLSAQLNEDLAEFFECFAGPKVIADVKVGIPSKYGRYFKYDRWRL